MYVYFSEYYIIINITYKDIDIQILHNNVYKHSMYIICLLICA